MRTPWICPQCGSGKAGILYPEAEIRMPLYIDFDGDYALEEIDVLDWGEGYLWCDVCDYVDTGITNLDEMNEKHGELKTPNLDKWEEMKPARDLVRFLWEKKLFPNMTWFQIEREIMKAANIDHDKLIEEKAELEKR
ncbi:MAG: hypothetical protein SVK08_00040 [Halobacteriota archaeon]|nr:hypothetical protein [Halobacteriota archaeon]